MAGESKTGALLCCLIAKRLLREMRHLDLRLSQRAIRELLPYMPDIRRVWRAECLEPSEVRASAGKGMILMISGRINKAKKQTRQQNREC